jgi:hypothetical protein
MAKAIQKYAANDGTLFDFELEADQYDARNRFEGRVQRFIDSKEWPRGRAAVTRSAVLDFLAFEATAPEALASDADDSVDTLLEETEEALAGTDPDA